MYQHLIKTIEGSQVQLKAQVNEMLLQIEGSELNNYVRINFTRHAMNIKTKWREESGAGVQKEISEIGEIFRFTDEEE